MGKWSEAADWIDSSSGSGVAHFFESRVTVLNWIPAMIRGNIFYVASHYLKQVPPGYLMEMLSFKNNNKLQLV